MVNSSWWKGLIPVERGLIVTTLLSVLSCIALIIGFSVMYHRQFCDSDYRGTTRWFTSRQSTCSTPVCLDAAAVFIDNMDKSVDPCNDFNKFACGNFIKKTKIPDDETHVNPFSIYEDKLLSKIRQTMVEPVAPANPDFVKHIKHLYKSCMDTKTIEGQGVEPLLKMLKELGGWPVLEGNKWNEADFNWMKSVYKFRDAGLSSDYFIKFTVGVDQKNTIKNIIKLDPASFGIALELILQGMSNNIVKAYHKYMIDVAVLLGVPMKVANDELTLALKFEESLAKITQLRGAHRAAPVPYNPITIREMSNRNPSIPWKQYLNGLLAPVTTVNDNEIIIVNSPHYFTGFAKLMATTPKRVQANYVMWRAVGASITFLNENLREKQLELMKEVTGHIARKARWKECVRIVSILIPFGVSSLYVKGHFSAEARKNAVELFQTVKTGLTQLMRRVDWMDRKTRHRALRKASAMSAKIGYPDELLDNNKLVEYYKNLKISGNSFLAGVLSAAQFNAAATASELRKPFNRTDWKNSANAAKVTAFYTPVENGIQIPAAILKERFFDSERPKYMNYGGIGFIMGHELTHAFDNRGRQYDGNGNIVDWWEPFTADVYLRKSQCMIQQYSKYFASEVGLHVDGKRTCDENISDNGGLKIAYLAYLRWASRNKRESSLPGLNYNPRQMFWITAATVWCAKYRPEKLKMMMVKDTHSPPEFRILGPFSNIPYFSRDFNCAKGTKMNPIKKCAVW